MLLLLLLCKLLLKLLSLRSLLLMGGIVVMGCLRLILVDVEAVDTALDIPLVLVDETFEGSLLLL